MAADARQGVLLATQKSHQPVLPALFEDWFARRGWSPRPHQLDLLDLARAGKSVLLIAPTGAGKNPGWFPADTCHAQPATKAQAHRTAAGRAHPVHLALESARRGYRAQSSQTC